MKTLPTHVWLLVCFLVLLVAYYIRPDPVTVDLVKAFSGALLLSLRTGNDQRPPPPPDAPNPASTAKPTPLRDPPKAPDHTIIQP